MKKRIVIVTRKMIMGGIEKALISMLKSIPKEKYDITVMVMGMGGELIEDLPDHVKIESLYGYERTTVEKIKNNIKLGRFIQAFKIGWYTLLAKRTNNVFKQEWYHTKMIQKLKINYDMAIAYHVPASLPVVFVMNNIKAKTKIAWIHADVSQFEKALVPYKKYYERYDKVFCVSEYAKYKFINLYPNLKDRTSVFYNIIDRNQIEALAKNEDGYNDHFEGIRILTVGRLTKEKGHDIIPQVISKLNKEGKNVRWYFIGDGECRPLLEEQKDKYGLDEELIFLGTKKNPYPYIKKCDIYVQPSRHEGYCISIAEARALNKPIVSTDTIGAKEQIRNDENGIIVKFDQNDLYFAINTLITNKELRIKFESKLKEDQLSANEITKLLKLVN
jgi:glycosyltransferase involved in cell wall biosynthesis